MRMNLELLPANIGIENVEINSLITEYNSLLLNVKKYCQVLVKIIHQSDN